MLTSCMVLVVLCFVSLTQPELEGGDKVVIDGVYTNPVIDLIGPADPHVIRYEGVYYLYPTWDSVGYDVFTSPDLVHWEHRGTCFDDVRGGVWAPDVFHNASGDGKFYLYYTVGPVPKKEIGVAVAETPLGPFEDAGTLIKKAIDAHMFQDTDGGFYLYYTETHPVLGNRLWVQPMDNPLQKTGESQLLLLPDEPWERSHGFVVEAPWMIKRKDLYYLMYSGSGANGPDYAIGYATSDTPLGPFTKHPENPIVKREDGIYGPGHHCVVEGPRGGLWAVYHQKADAKINWKRFLAVDPIWFDENGVIHMKATRGTEQPAP